MTETTPGARRPRDRHHQVARAAAALFSRHGYPSVGVDDIASSVGITGGAIYRHFRSKEQLLAEVVQEATQRLEEALTDDADDGAATLDRAIALMVTLILDRRDVAALVQREIRHLGEPVRTQALAGLASLSEQAVALLRARRPELSIDDAAFLTEAAFAVLASPSYHSKSLPRAEFAVLLQRITTAVATTTVALGPGDPSPGDPVESDGAAAPWAVGDLVGSSRREALVTAAIGHFGRRSYASVTMEDIGSSVGIAGPSIYAHFPTKAELLFAVLTRAAEWLHYGMTRALRARTPDSALEAVVSSYVDFVVDNPNLVGVLLTGLDHVPDEQRHSLRRMQHDYVAQWVRLLVAGNSEVTTPKAWVIAYAVIGIVNDVGRRKRFRRRPDLRGDLNRLALDVLRRTSRPVAVPLHLPVPPAAMPPDHL